MEVSMIGFDASAPKRPVNMSLNEDLVRKAREIAGNLSEQVERLLAEYVLEEQRKRAEEESRLDAAITAWNAFDERVGSVADDDPIV
jgi:antitoxin CcdA